MLSEDGISKENRKLYISSNIEVIEIYPKIRRCGAIGQNVTTFWIQIRLRVNTALDTKGGVKGKTALRGYWTECDDLLDSDTSPSEYSFG